MLDRCESRWCWCCWCAFGPIATPGKNSVTKFIHEWHYAGLTQWFFAATKKTTALIDRKGNKITSFPYSFQQYCRFKYIILDHEHYQWNDQSFGRRVGSARRFRRAPKVLERDWLSHSAGTKNVATNHPKMLLPTIRTYTILSYNSCILCL